MIRPSAVVALGLLVALAGCDRHAAPAPAAQPGPVNANPRVATYRCDDGRTVEAGYPDEETAVVTLGGHAYSLKSALSADGARYVGMGLQWWAKGTKQARLSRLAPGEDTATDPGVECHTSGPAAAPVG